MKPDFRIPAEVRIYDEGVKSVRIAGIKDFIRDRFGIGKIRRVIVKKSVVAVRGLELDTIATQDTLDAVRGPMREDTCDIILTSRLFATLGEDNRLHIRASVYSFPSVISTSGIVEGPAKPRDYYLYRQRYARLGIWDREAHRIAERFKGQFIDYGDSRLTEVVKGYAAQALFFYMTGNPFCERNKCRLYNAHWQEDLIRAQIKCGEFCSAHKKALERIIKTGTNH